MAQNNTAPTGKTCEDCIFFCECSLIGYFPDNAPCNEFADIAEMYPDFVKQPREHTKTILCDDCNLFDPYQKECTINKQVYKNTCVHYSPDEPCEA